TTTASAIFITPSSPSTTSTTTTAAAATFIPFPAYSHRHSPPLLLPPLVILDPPPPSPPRRRHRTFDHDHENDHVSTPADLIPVRYSGESYLSTGHLARITPFKRNVLVLFHRASPADFKEYLWILQHGVSESCFGAGASGESRDAEGVGGRRVGDAE
ncbi:hypothetical protein GRF29_69g2136575, partial [Pseudopithomyces chartarum]